MKHILITGGAGFIGSHTADLLLAKNFKVTVYDNLMTGKIANLDWSHPQLTIIQEDILNYNALKKSIGKADAILHLAALPSVAKSIEDPIHSIKINSLGFLHVLQAIREINPQIRLVYASSAAVYGNPQQLPCEDSLNIHYNLQSPYALEKTNNEKYALLFKNLFQLNTLGLRYFNVYGTRQDPASPYSGVISKLIANLESENNFEIFGDGLQSRDFIHVQDVARANLLALESNENGVLNIATGKPETLNNLVNYINTIKPKKINVKYSAYRKGDIKHSFGCTKNAEKKINFKAEINLENGLKNLLISSTQ